MRLCRLRLYAFAGQRFSKQLTDLENCDLERVNLHCSTVRINDELAAGLLSANQNDVILSYITKYDINIGENTEHHLITHSLEQLSGVELKQRQK